MEISENTNKHFFGVPPPPGYKPESIVLESANIIHSVNCNKIGCKCTPIKDCNKLDELRSQQYRESHKGKYSGVRAKRAQKQEQQQQQQRDKDFLAFPKQDDDADPMEDFEPI